MFTSNKAKVSVFPHDAFHKYRSWEGKDYITEAVMGSFTCLGCRNKIQVSRQVQMKGNRKLIDNLRFEQAIEGGAGRCVKTMPTSFNEDYIEFKKCRIDKLEGEMKMNGDGSSYELLWEKDYGVVECFRCGRFIDFVNHVRRRPGEEGVSWSMTSKV